MPAAWVDSYFMSYRPAVPGSLPSITFHGWTTGGVPYTAFLNVPDMRNFEVIKTQLESKNVWVEWDGSTLQVYKIVTITTYP